MLLGGNGVRYRRNRLFRPVAIATFLTTTVARLTSTAAFGAQATADAQMGIVGFPPISAVRRSCREGQLRVTTG
jgi:hypothetical protein